MEDFVVYSKPSCPYCTKVAAVLDSKGISYTKLTLEEDYTRDEFLDKFGKSTFPRVLHNGELVGGFMETVNYLVQNGYV